jgi:hypothetical protein
MGRRVTDCSLVSGIMHLVFPKGRLRGVSCERMDVTAARTTGATVMFGIPNHTDTTERSAGRPFVPSCAPEYSSLGYLKQLTLDRLKIDRSFVCRVHEDANDAAIAEAIIKMLHALGLLVIAEGIELQEQLIFLAELGCDEIQGYLLSKPLSSDEAGRFMEGCRSIE